MLKRIKQGLIALCVAVTLALGALFIAYPQPMLDFFQVMFLVKWDYYQPVSIGKLIEGATIGITEAVEDNYTYYVDPESNQLLYMNNLGQTGGIGVTVDGVKSLEDRLIIREVQPDSGAGKAGLQPEDGILKIDDHWVKDLTAEEAIYLVRGLPGTTVTLLIARGDQDPWTVVVERTMTLTLETVAGGVLKEDYLPGYNIGYIAIGSFAQNSDELFDEILDELLLENIDGLILDLRNNGGGDVMATTRIAGRFLPGGDLMRLDLKGGQSQSFPVTNVQPFDLPLVVLVNGASASASEILAGAIQDGEAGALVGTTTFGKGSVQNVYRLLTGAGLRVTEGKYFLPSGRSIDGVGIEPDVEVARDLEAEEDNQLQKALEVLAGMIQ